MEYKSRAISLHYIKYGESSIITKLFTEKKGLQNFIVKGVRSSRSKKKLSLFQALELSIINAKYVPKKNLQHLTEITFAFPKKQNSVDMQKSFLYLFVAEVLSKTIKENEIDDALFLFTWNLKIQIQKASKIDANFPLQFLILLSEHLGFFPLKESEKKLYFNLESGEFVNKKPLSHFINKKNTCYFKNLLENRPIKIPYVNRRQLLLDLLDYYKLQNHEIKNLTSHIIIESLRS